MFQINRGMPTWIILAMPMNNDALGPFPELIQFIERSSHFSFLPHNADEVLHHLLQIALYLIRAFTILSSFRCPVEWSQRLADGALDLRIGNRAGAMLLVNFCREFPPQFPEYDLIRQTTTTETIRPV